MLQLPPGYSLAAKRLEAGDEDQRWGGDERERLP
jgi:hypothetical protein